MLPHGCDLCLYVYNQEDAKDKQQESEEVQLRIAWQYRRYIKSKQKAAADTRCA